MKRVHILESVPKFLRASSKAGAAPGTLKHIGERKVEHTTLEAWRYDREAVEERTFDSIEGVEEFSKKSKVTWINVNGIHDEKMIEEIGKTFGLHSLLLEDILNTTQRPKIEEYDNCMFTVIKMLHLNTDSETVTVEQVSLVLMDNILLTFQERPQDVFDDIRERLRSGLGRLRKTGPDYLLYRIIDAVCDGYLTVIDQMGERVETMEEESFSRPDDAFITSVYGLRRQTLFVRKAVQPLRDVTAHLERAESDLIDNGNVVYFRDVHDHASQAVDSIDTFRDLLGTMLDNYLSIMSHKTNMVMKVLTVMASIFIPLTFIVGVYGMNFDYMPELRWQWGYPAIWIVMITIAFGLIAFFKRKKWM